MKKKMYTPNFDLQIPNSQLKSRFNFDNDFKVGQAGENLVSEIFNNKNIKLEIKRDDWTKKSGNIAVEIECRGKPSGLSVTEAHYWIFVIFDNVLLMIPTIVLKSMVSKLEQNPKNIRMLGDRDKLTGEKVAKCVLLPLNELINLSKA